MKILDWNSRGCYLTYNRKHYTPSRHCHGGNATAPMGSKIICCFRAKTPFRNVPKKLTNALSWSNLPRSQFIRCSPFMEQRPVSRSRVPPQTLTVSPSMSWQVLAVLVHEMVLIFRLTSSQLGHYRSYKYSSLYIVKEIFTDQKMSLVVFLAPDCVIAASLYHRKCLLCQWEPFPVFTTFISFPKGLLALVPPLAFLSFKFKYGHSGTMMDTITHTLTHTWSSTQGFFSFLFSI